MAKYRLTNEAVRDLERIWLYGLIQFGESQADKYFEALVDRFEQLSEKPYHYQSVEYIKAGYRRSVCGVDAIYYRVVDEQVEIVRVLGRQDRNLEL